MKPYTLSVNRTTKQVAAKSYLEALIEESLLQKQNGRNKFTIECSNINGKLGIYVRG